MPSLLVLLQVEYKLELVLVDLELVDLELELGYSFSQALRALLYLLLHLRRHTLPTENPFFTKGPSAHPITQ